MREKENGNHAKELHEIEIAIACLKPIYQLDVIYTRNPETGLGYDEFIDGFYNGLLELKERYEKGE